MELGKNIRRLRKLNNLTQQSLANQLNRSKTLIALWEKGERDPSSIDLKRLSEIFNVRADDIIGSIPSFSNTETYELNDDQVLKPILGTVKAGYNLYCEENIEGYKPVDKNKAKGAECFWLRVIGNSMNAIGIVEGALVLVKKVIVENNQIAVVRVNGDEATVKQIIFNNDAVILQPLSTDPSNKPLILKREDFDNNHAEIIGKVVEVSFNPNDLVDK
ncbi:LexA family protein [Faecalibacillus intestinalis]|uniref:LexA family protein n=1 Tax=Faecalibacillus intestinalis TaxID=1982626 RepID=UPI002FD957AD